MAHLCDIIVQPLAHKYSIYLWHHAVVGSTSIQVVYISTVVRYVYFSTFILSHCKILVHHLYEVSLHLLDRYYSANL